MRPFLFSGCGSWGGRTVDHLTNERTTKHGPLKGPRRCWKEKKTHCDYVTGPSCPFSLTKEERRTREFPCAQLTHPQLPLILSYAQGI